MSRFLLGERETIAMGSRLFGKYRPVNGKNYLVPVDAELTAPAPLRTRTFRPKS